MTPLLTQHHQAIRDCCHRYGVLRLDVFGSALRDDFDPADSDIDLLVAFPRHRTTDNDGMSPADRYLGLLADLEALLGKPVDLVDVRGARNPYFMAEVLKQREVLYAA